MSVDLKPLYLDGHTSMRILRDGPALRVRRAEQADRLFPLARLSRVIVLGQPDWDTAALLACAEAGVAVVFLASDGEVRATLQGGVARRPMQTADALLSELCERPAQLHVYHDWVYGLDHQERYQLVRTSGKSTWSIDAQTLAQRYAEQLTRHTSRREAQRFAEAVNGSVKAFVCAHLAKAGFDVSRPAFAASRIDPVDDLSRILHWSLLPAQAGYLRRLSRAASRSNGNRPRIGLKDAARFFELHKQGLIDKLDELLHRLHIRLLEAASTNGH